MCNSPTKIILDTFLCTHVILLSQLHTENILQVKFYYIYEISQNM